MQFVEITGNANYAVNINELNAEEFMVYYGLKNDVQSYGGGSITLNQFSAKPCFLPLYDNIGERCIAYIYIEPRNNLICAVYQNDNATTIRFQIYYR